MVRKMFLWWLATAWLLCGHALADQHVVIVTPRGETSMEQTFMQELRRRLGTVRFTLIKPDLANPSEMKALPDRIREQRPNLIYSWGTPTTLAVAGTFEAPVINDIPIVFLVVADPLRAKIVRELKVPGRNVTGTSHLAPLSVQLSAIREFKPFKSIGVVYNPKEPNMKYVLDDLSTEGKKNGFQVLAQPVGLDAAGQPDPGSIESRIRKLKSEGADWLYLGPDTFIAFTHRKATTAAAISAGLPAFTANESAIQDGYALYGLHSPIENLARFTAYKASQVLSGERKITDIPVETLQRFSSTINLCAAIALKVFPPSALFKLADVITPQTDALVSPDITSQTAVNPQAKGCRFP